MGLYSSHTPLTMKLPGSWRFSDYSLVQQLTNLCRWIPFHLFEMQRKRETI
ncbi:hypothetical protein Lalb_Chr12g0199641 [Lupinus albus]|uniref:Uncharacterized protein n=1 Tax=Lupinus albus TaxID=3870 RepID=A0A6A4PMC4_LUPAL|nr:hypothetical protein Lalb_Chr12g0199641 [Lupinus albus]